MLAVVGMLAACASTRPPAPAEWDGLEYRRSDRVDALYLRPGPSTGTYRTVLIAPLVIATDPDWMPTRNITTGTVIGRHPVSSEENRYVAEKLGAEFARILAEELAAGGYRVVSEPAQDTVRVAAGLTNVWIDTQETSMVRRRDRDTMTLVADLSDASTADVLARVIDEKRGRMGTLQLPNTVVNHADFRDAVRDWARGLRSLLDEMNGTMV
jgi:hypothetical protein